MSARKLASWIDAFQTFTARLGSPEIFCTWAGLVTVAGALERKVWIRTDKGDLYPNLYVIIVGPPGVGKTLATAEAHSLLEPLTGHTAKDLHLGANNVSRASMIDDLKAADRILISANQIPTSFNAMTIMVDELGVLLPSYENDFMNILTNIYDNRGFHEKKRGRELNIKMDKPTLNLVAATTPAYLNALLPEGAWDQGFMSRVICVYSGEAKITELWGQSERSKDEFDALSYDLKIIANMHGKMTFTEEAAGAISAWHRKGGPPLPDHPKLTYYNTRRTAHLLKLCMIASAQAGDDLIISVDHFYSALRWLVEAETFMPDIFKAMRTGGDSRVIEDTYHFVYALFMKNNRPVPEHLLIEFLSERTPAHNIGRVIDVMTRMKIIEAKLEKLGMCYVPRAKRAI